MAPLSAPEVARFAERWLPAWTGNDPERLAAFYADDVFYLDPVVSAGVRGKPALLEHFRTLLGRNPAWVWEQVEGVPLGDGFLSHWRAAVPVAGTTVQLAGVSVVGLDDAGRIRRNEVYFDRAPLRAAHAAARGDGRTGPPPVLETPRLLLRLASPADAEALLPVYSDPEVMRFWPSPPLSDAAAVGAHLGEIAAGMSQGLLYQWAVVRRSDERTLGACTLYSLSAEHRRGEVGGILGREHWGGGYMAEALPAVLRFGFETLGLARIEADADPANLPAIRFLERIGFRREGLLRARYRFRDGVQDAAVYGLLGGEFGAGVGSGVESRQLLPPASKNA